MIIITLENHLKKINMYIKTIKYYYRYLFKLLDYYFINLCFYISYDIETGTKRIETLLKIICILCFFFTRNPNLGIDLLYIFSNNYLDLTQDNSFVYINSSSGNNNPFGIGSSNNGSSNPNSNPNPNPLPGFEPGYEHENYHKRVQELRNQPVESVFSLRNDNKFTGRQLIKRSGEPLSNEPANKKIRNDKQPETGAILNKNAKENTTGQQNPVNNKVPIQPNRRTTNFDFIHGTKKPREPQFTNNVVSGPKFFFFDKAKNMAIYPESLHMNYPTLYANNTVRIYYENGLVYTYNCNFSKPSQYYCSIKYPDSTTCDIYDIPTLVKNIELHKNHVKLGYSMNPEFDYNQYYVDKLEIPKKKAIDELLAKFSKDNSTRRIQPNSIPKNIDDKVNNVALNVHYYGKLVPKKKKIVKQLFENSNQ